MTHEAFDKTTDLLGRLDTTQLYPPFLERLNTLLNACAERGQLYVATSGFRSHAEQDALYARGRTTPGMQVTKARGGQSMHNFGLAVDFAPHMLPVYKGKLRVDYHPYNYKILGHEAALLGLEWGGNWTSIKDTPHIQWKLPGDMRLSDLDLAFRKNNILSEAWALL